jgi:ATP-dependent Clp protease ATP-binding subunit ClpB
LILFFYSLIGAPPGYVGYDSGGILTDGVRRRPYQLVLLDEFEKAHREVSNLLLQVFDEGRLTDSQGRVVDFKNTVIIMTSNLGSDILARYSEVNEDDDSDEELINNSEEKSLETSSSDSSSSVSSPLKLDKREKQRLKKQSKRELATKLVHQHFSPEFVNRLDDVIVFNSLTLPGIIQICSIQLNKVKQLLKEKGISFYFSDKAAEEIAHSGSNLQYGARPLKRLIQNEILSPLATMILTGEVKVGDELYLSTGNNGKSFMESVVGSSHEPQGSDKTTTTCFHFELSNSPSTGNELETELVTGTSSEQRAKQAPKMKKRRLEGIIRRKSE